MKIGIDFGTTYTKIAYIDPTGKLQLFQFPQGTPEQKPYIPTMVSYQKLAGNIIRSIGQLARLHESDDGMTFCENFKILLPFEERKQWQHRNWLDDAPEPREVVRDYLQILLREDRYSFENILQPIESVVVSVPQNWQDRIGNPGAETLKQILTQELGLPLNPLRSEPVCAAAYCASRYWSAEERGKPINLLVCDMGGGTFDVALCTVEYPTIIALDFDGDTGCAGVTFDRAVTNLMWTAEHKQSPDLHNPDFLKLLREFETLKIISGEETRERIKVSRSNPDAQIPIYTLGRYELSLDQLEQAFRPIKESMMKVLNAIQERANEAEWTIDRIAIVGGFGQFPLVQETIRQFWHADELGVEFDETVGMEQGAIAMGAALIVNSVIDPRERYPHTIFVRGRDDHDLETEVEVPLIEAAQVPTEGLDTDYFARYKRTGTLVTCRILNETHHGQLPIFVRKRGKRDVEPCFTKVKRFPPPGRYYIGLRIDQANLVILIFEPVPEENNTTAQRTEYALHELNFSQIIIEREEEQAESVQETEEILYDA